MKEKYEETMEETTFYCARCRTSEDLYTLEQKNLHHEVIGVVFVCGKCADSLTGKSMQISFGGDVDTNGQEYDFSEMDDDITGYETWN